MKFIKILDGHSTVIQRLLFKYEDSSVSNNPLEDSTVTQRLLFKYEDKGYFEN